MCKAFDWKRMIFPLGYTPVTRKKATSSHRKSWVSDNFTFRLRYLGEKYVHTQISQQVLGFNHFYSFIWCSAPVQRTLIYPKQHSHSNSNSTKQTAARFWTNVHRTCFLLRHVFSVEKRVHMRRKYYLMTVPLQPNALRWEGVYWLWR